MEKREYFDGIRVREDVRRRKREREERFAASIRVALTDLDSSIEFYGVGRTFVAKTENGDKFRITIAEV